MAWSASGKPNGWARRDCAMPQLWREVSAEGLVPSARAVSGLWNCAGTWRRDRLLHRRDAFEHHAVLRHIRGWILGRAGSDVSESAVGCASVRVGSCDVAASRPALSDFAPRLVGSRSCGEASIGEIRWRWRLKKSPGSMKAPGDFCVQRLRVVGTRGGYVATPRRIAMKR